MKIKEKIVLTNLFTVALVALIGFIAFQGLDSMLTKLRFVEIADDLNASFLEMRIAEKNFFLYQDNNALAEINEKIEHATSTMEQAVSDIKQAIGAGKLQQLSFYLKDYAAVIDEVIKLHCLADDTAARVRNGGRKLREFSDYITKLERVRVSRIISNSKTVVFFSFWAIIISVAVVTRLVFGRIVDSLQKIEQLATSISEGNFNKIEGVQSHDELGSVIKAVNSMSDELKNREEEIIQSKKLASLGILTAGVAHELTNPLNNISMMAQTYEEVYDHLGKEQRIEFMRKVDSETERIRSIVVNLLDFSKPKKATLAASDINVVIHKTLKLVQNVLDISKVDTHLSLAEELPRVFIDERQVQQVLVNLIVNASQAMDDIRILDIMTMPAKTSGFVEIRVKDTGRGIPPEYLSHIFDPFFSTKDGSGTGLGLSVSYGIIRNLKGNIRVESEVGIGTTFTIELPVYKGMEDENGEA
jgi:two-component system NtrC family sensor kinase